MNASKGGGKFITFKMLYFDMTGLVPTYSDIYTAIKEAYEKLTEEERERAAWFEEARLIAQRAIFSLNERSELDEGFDSQHFEPYIDDFHVLLERCRTLLAKTDIVTREEEIWKELRRLEDRISTLIDRHRPKRHGPTNQERPTAVLESAKGVKSIARKELENVGVGRAIREKLP